MIRPKEYKPIALSGDIPQKARFWRNNIAVWKWCRQNTLLSELDQEKWLEKIEYDPTIKMFGVYCYGKERQNFVGVCGFTSINTLNRSAEFSLYIGPEAQGKGYGRKALELLIAHGFMDFGFKRIWGEVFEGNPAMTMFERIGFVHDGTLRSSYWKSGRWIDSHLISILDEEWYQMREKKPRLVDGN
jgi:RimJ/RimL family protein N-acetyltransferase